MELEYYLILSSNARPNWDQIRIILALSGHREGFQGNRSQALGEKKAGAEGMATLGTLKLL